MATAAIQPGMQTLQELVNAIIDERIRGGQLDESSLTLSDIAKIRQAFINTLQGIYHPRVRKLRASGGQTFLATANAACLRIP
ncbi:MAG: hypothetical protein U0Z44_11155 [Kouleothrix sp.]